MVPSVECFVKATALAPSMGSAGQENRVLGGVEKV